MIEALIVVAVPVEVQQVEVVKCTAEMAPVEVQQIEVAKCTAEMVLVAAVAVVDRKQYCMIVVK